MASTYQTLNDLIRLNDKNANDYGVSDLLQDAPLLAALYATTSSNGTKHTYEKETAAPVVGFRAINSGRDNSKSTGIQVTTDLKVLDASFAVDKALADAYTKGGASAYLAREANKHLRAAFFAAENQFVNGTGSDSDGFSGFSDALDEIGEMVIDAGGSETSSGVGCSSVYLLRTNADETDVIAVTGNNGEIVVGDSSIIRAEDGSGKFYSAYYTPIEGWIGLQVGGKYSIARIANLDGSDSALLTDDLIYDAISRFPAARRPNMIVMGRSSLKSLRQSRTATNATGAPAPLPTDVDGIKIVVTDACNDGNEGQVS